MEHLLDLHPPAFVEVADEAGAVEQKASDLNKDSCESWQLVGRTVYSELNLPS